MAKSFARALTGVIVFAYGLFTIALYALISISKGTYFKRPTEKEKLELQLGENYTVSLWVNTSLTNQLATACGISPRTLKAFPTTS